MSAVPAYAMGGLCIVGGVTGFARTRSIPSLVAGVGVGLLFLYSANQLSSLNTSTGLNTALAASAVLFLSSVPRARKGPVPATLAVTAALTGAYYGNAYYRVRGARVV